MRNKHKLLSDVRTESKDYLIGTGFSDNSNYKYVSVKTVHRKQILKKIFSLRTLLIVIFMMLVYFGFWYLPGIKVNTEKNFYVAREVVFSNKRNGYVMCIDPSNRKTITLNKMDSYYITGNEGYIYCSSAYGNSNLDDKETGIYCLTRYRFNKELKISDEPGRLLRFSGKRVYYESNGSIYSIINDGSEEPKKLTNKRYERIEDLIVDDGKLYFSADNCIYVMKVDGTNLLLLTEDNGTTLCSNEEWIYYTNQSDNNALYRIHRDGTNREYLSDDIGVSAGMSISDGYIYYCNNLDSNRIYRIRTDGTKVERLTINRTISDYVPQVVDGYIYYVNIGDFNRLYKLSEDGTYDQMVIPGKQQLG